MSRRGKPGPARWCSEAEVLNPRMRPRHIDPKLGSTGAAHAGVAGLLADTNTSVVLRAESIAAAMAGREVPDSPCRDAKPNNSRPLRLQFDMI